MLWKTLQWKVMLGFTALHAGKADFQLYGLNLNPVVEICLEVQTSSSKFSQVVITSSR